MEHFSVSVGLSPSDWLRLPLSLSIKKNLTSRLKVKRFHKPTPCAATPKALTPRLAAVWWFHRRGSSLLFSVTAAQMTFSRATVFILAQINNSNAGVKSEALQLLFNACHSRLQRAASRQVRGAAVGRRWSIRCRNKAAVTLSSNQNFTGHSQIYDEGEKSVENLKWGALSRQKKHIILPSKQHTHTLSDHCQH